MSRCFPFPPPGYEKKAKTDDVDALIKDKQKEKKHKKEKKDKKKEGKDKDKERSKDKDREKKERKEKHKDKDKDKDKKRSKDKKRTDENKTEGQFDASSSSGWKQNESNLQAGIFKDTNLLPCDRRIADEERGRRDQMVENPMACDTSKDDAVAMLVDKYYDNWVQDREKVEDKDGQDNKGERQSIKLEGKVGGNSSVPSFSGAEEKRSGTAVKPMEKGTENSSVPSFSGAEQKRTGSAVKPMEKNAENSLGPSFNGAEQKRTGSTVKPMERDAERKMDGKEKKKDKGVNDKRKEKHRRRDGEKKSKEKKAEKEKMKEKVKHEDRKEKTIEVPNNHINTLNIKPIQIPQDSEKSRSMDDNSRKRKDFETVNVKPIQIPEDSEKCRSVEDNPRKRKDFETLNIKPIQILQDSEKSRSMEENSREKKDSERNGYLHDNVLSSKLPRTTLPSHPPVANGKKPEPCQPASPFAVPMPRGSNYVRFDKRSLAVNGLIKEKPSPVSGTTSLSVPRAKAKENGESSQKPPHPDSKYLSQILTVPKMDDLSGFDDQEWLFSTDRQVKKPKSVSSGVDGSPQVWDRALRIDSADICVLPYVIPY